MPRPLPEQVIVITGASSGIGRETAHHLARHGASLVLVARNEAALRETAAEVEAFGGRALVAPADVSDPEQMQRVADLADQPFRSDRHLGQRCGRLDLQYRRADHDRRDTAHHRGRSAGDDLRDQGGVALSPSVRRHADQYLLRSGMARAERGPASSTCPRVTRKKFSTSSLYSLPLLPSQGQVAVEAQLAGYGLGLSIVADIVDAWKGRFEIETAIPVLLSDWHSRGLCLPKERVWFRVQPSACSPDMGRFEHRRDHVDRAPMWRRSGWSGSGRCCEGDRRASERGGVATAQGTAYASSSVRVPSLNFGYL